MWRKILSGYRIKVFIGYDSREDIAYQVAKHSIEQTCKYPEQLEIHPLKLKDLIKEGNYTRDVDPLASTEFTFSRFLIPHLCNFNGWALFIDCDFLFTTDIRKLFYKVKTFLKTEGETEISLGINYNFGDSEIATPSSFTLTTEGAAVSYDEISTNYGDQSIIINLDYKKINNNYFLFKNNGFEKIEIELNIFFKNLVKFKF